MNAGTSSSRTIVASISTARASMKPICLISRIRVNMKDAKTTTMMLAAAVMTRAVWVMPSRTARRLSAVRSHSSRMRESMNT